ncbi:PTS sugar transporter subunit IIB [Aquiluna borgnonia]|uniref:PTS sugar transporter subunit IIB n=1 Tax=Aquiluna borgnonia TaxID=2499157 RepID=A0A7D4Q5L7_9MICO|nr:PTS sugar transporter subunit IIB [Aquiluna borgnonia]QKJ24862.1 PTS sugar transporter subunit IIB [Aquiluna borgnonia]
MKIYAVCGAGIGTSVLLKSNVDRVLQSLGIEAEVQAVSVSAAMADDSPAQLVFITPELQSQINGIRSEVVVINNIFDLAELSEKLTKSLG